MFLGFKNNFNKLNNKIVTAGLQCLSIKSNFSTVAGSEFEINALKGSVTTRRAIMRNMREFVYSLPLKNQATGGMLQRSRSLVQHVTETNRVMDAGFLCQTMQLAQQSRFGWVWDRTVSAPHNASAATLRSIRRGQFSLFDTNRTAYAIRSLIGRGLHNVSVPTLIGSTKPKTLVVKPRAAVQYRTTFYKLLRLRFERWFFKCLGGRTYIWFSNIWRDVTSRVNPATLSSMYSACMQKLAKKGSRFYMEPQQAHIVFQSIFLAVASVTGLQFFMKMMSSMISMFRSHWQLVRHLMGLFFRCKNYFWFKSLYNYRLIMRGKFGGQLRARQEVFQHGVVKIHQWDQNVNYYRVFPVTIYGVFSVRFWLQMRDMRMLRLVDATRDIVRNIHHKKPRARRSRA